MIAALALLAMAAGAAANHQEIRTPEDRDFMTVHMKPLRLSFLGPAAADVVTNVKVLGAQENGNLPLSEQVTLLCSLQNMGEVPMNVTGIMGSLNMPEAFQIYYVNFTYKHFGDVVEPAQEVTFAYPFKLRPEDLVMVNQYADERDTRVQMAMSVFYEDSDGLDYSSTFFNETVTFAPTASSVDSAFLLTLARDVAVGGAILFAVAYAVLGQGVDGVPAPLKSVIAPAAAADEGAAPSGLGVGDAAVSSKKKAKGGKKKGKGNRRH